MPLSEQLRSGPTAEEKRFKSYRTFESLEQSGAAISCVGNYSDLRTMRQTDQAGHVSVIEFETVFFGREESPDNKPHTFFVRKI